MRSTSRLAERHRLVVLPEEARDLRHVLDQMIGLVRQIGLDQDVAGKEFALGVHLVPAAHLHDFLGRHHDVLDEIGKPLDRRLALDLLGRLLLEVRVGVDDVPLRCHRRKNLQPSQVHAEKQVQANAERVIDNGRKTSSKCTHHDEHHDRGELRLLPRRPCHLGRLAADLREKLNGFDCAVPASGSRPSMSLQPCVHCASQFIQLAGVEGLEPPAYGFGDRRSTN